MSLYRRIHLQVNDCVKSRLATLPTAPTARAAVEKGFACVAPDLDTAIAISDTIGAKSCILLLGSPTNPLF